MPKQGLPSGTRIRIVSGRYAGRIGTVEANVFQRTVDYPEEFAMGFHMVLDDETLITVRRDQVRVTGPTYGQTS